MKKGAWSILAVDATGAALTALLLGFTAWSAFSDEGGAVESAHQLAATVSETRSDVARLQAALDAQVALELRHQAELVATGAMPAQTPQEGHLRTVSGLAAANHLSVIRQLPLSPREYPGLMEQRFAFEVAGTTTDLARFFKAVETSPGWTDISYLKIEPVATAGASADRIATLTFSVFSMAKELNSPTSQGG